MISDGQAIGLGERLEEIVRELDEAGDWAISAQVSLALDRLLDRYPCIPRAIAAGSAPEDE